MQLPFDERLVIGKINYATTFYYTVITELAKKLGKSKNLKTPIM